MNDNELMFDDWAMRLLKEWLEIRDEYNTIVDARQQHLLKANGPILTELRDQESQAYFDLIDYLFRLLEYDVPRHRYGYPSYLTLTKACDKALKTYRHMIIASRPWSSQHDVLETNFEFSGEAFGKIERNLKESLAKEGCVYFAYSSTS